MNSDGSGSMRLTFNNEEERAPSWSPDGTKILYMCRALWLNSGTDFELCVMDANGSNLEVLTNNTMPDLTPNWTPDGSEDHLSPEHRWHQPTPHHERRWHGRPTAHGDPWTQSFREPWLSSAATLIGLRFRFELVTFSAGRRPTL